MTHSQIWIQEKVIDQTYENELKVIKLPIPQKKKENLSVTCLSHTQTP